MFTNLTLSNGGQKHCSGKLIMLNYQFKDFGWDSQLSGVVAGWNSPPETQTLIQVSEVSGENLGRRRGRYNTELTMVV